MTRIASRVLARAGTRALGAVVLALLCSLAWGRASGASVPRVVVSIQPLHSLVAAVMAGVGEPSLLLTGAESPHRFSLTPADARALSQAGLVVWAGETLETALAKPIAALARQAAVLEANRADGVTLLTGHEGNSADPHTWLDPRNAAAIAHAAAGILARIDPANGARYAANAAALEGRLRDLEQALARELAPVRGVPFVVFHDAYRYFERRFALNPVGSIAISAERAPGAKRIVDIRARLRETGAVCVFTEPQFDPALARVAVEGTQAKLAVLDPLGADLPPGPGAYFTLLRNMAASLHGCLASGS